MEGVGETLGTLFGVICFWVMPIGWAVMEFIA